MRIKLGFVLCILITLVFPSPLLAQQQTSSVNKKNIVKNFKANLNEYLPFGTSDCTQKPKGDANCDGLINQFDLSIWEIEFNAKSNPKRSDFNGDGVITLLDFGVWRNTFYPKQSANSGSFFTFLSSIFKDKVASFAYLQQSLITNLYAQETQSGLTSKAFISGSGNSLIANSDLNGNTQQVNFDPNGNTLSSQLFDKNGQLTAGVSFLNSGTTVVTTQQDGIQIQINKTAGGVVIEYFRNPDGSLIAIKSWPTLASYQSGEPPLSVTIPGQGNTRNVLNIQPNGDGIVEKTDNFGNVLSRNQLRRNGTLVSEDFQNKTIVQSNSQVGFTTLSMDNNLGGNTQYMFFKGELYGIVQTKSKDSYFIAKPLDLAGDSWSFESNINGVKVEKTVSDPIKELKSNTPDPKELIRYINYYKSAKLNPDAIDFSDGFTSNARAIQSQIQKANEILTISQTASPAVLGIMNEFATNVVKEAKAQQASVIGTLPGGISVVDGSAPNQYEYRDSLGNPADVNGNRGFNVNITSWTPTQGPLAGQQVSAAEVQYFNAKYEVTNSQTVVSSDRPTTQTLNPGQIARDTTGATPPAPAAQPAPALPAGPTQPPDPTAPVPPAAAVANATTGVPTPFAMGNLAGTVITAANGTIIATLTGGTHGQTVFTQNLTTLETNFKDDRGTFTAYGGVLTAIAGAAEKYGAPAGTIYALNHANQLVAVASDKEIGPDGRVLSGHGRSITPKEIDAGAIRDFKSQQLETAHGGGSPNQVEVKDSKCFLAGTLISTPKGPVAIETLKLVDKVYSYNEKTGEKEISDFEELDINFVDEYLIINNLIHTTTYHPFYIVTDTGLKTIRADELKTGDFLQSEEGKNVPITSIQMVKEKTTVYNLMNVSPNNNFYAEKILVHNYDLVGGERAPDPIGGYARNADGTLTQEWADNLGFNPSVFSRDDIAPPGAAGGTDAGSGSTGPGNTGGTPANTGNSETEGQQIDAGGNFGGEQVGNAGGDPSTDSGSGDE